MNPQEKLFQLDNKSRANGLSFEEEQWLIARVKKLESKMENIAGASFDLKAIDFKRMGKQALEDDSDVS